MNSSTQSRTSRIWLVPVLAILAGTGVGAASAITRYEAPEMILPGHHAGVGSQNAVAITDATPRAVIVDGNEFDFGVMARGEKKSHSFQVRNIGNGDLTLSVVNTTCKCTVGSLERDTIPSGETVDITLTWEAKSYAREFRQSATIETNDRSTREIILSVHGKVVQLAMPETPMVQFNRVSRSESLTFETPIYGFRDEDLQITGHEFFDNSVADFFDVQIEPLSKDKWNEPNATSALNCKVEIKPGLPVGEVRQGIRLHTNKPDIPSMEISIEMNVVSDISVVGPKLDSNKNILDWGQPALKEVDNRRSLFLIVKGPFKDQVDFSVSKADPAGVLDATFGEAVDVKRNVDGKETVIAKRIPMNVIIKKGSAGVQRMGSLKEPYGRIHLNTNHPEIEEFVIKVKFFVQ